METPGAVMTQTQWLLPQNANSHTEHANASARASQQQGQCILSEADLRGGGGEKVEETLLWLVTFARRWQQP